MNNWIKLLHSLRCERTVPEARPFACREGNGFLHVSPILCAAFEGAENPLRFVFCLRGKKWIFYAPSYPYGFLGGGAGELFLQRTVPPHINMYIMNLYKLCLPAWRGDSAASVFIGRAAGVFSEKPAEITGIGKARLLRHLADAQRGIQQQFLGLVHAHGQDEAIG